MNNLEYRYFNLQKNKIFIKIKIILSCKLAKSSTKKIILNKY